LLLYCETIPRTFIWLLNVRFCSLKIITGIVELFCFKVKMYKPGVWLIDWMVPLVLISLSIYEGLICEINISGGLYCRRTMNKMNMPAKEIVRQMANSEDSFTSIARRKNIY